MLKLTLTFVALLGLSGCAGASLSGSGIQESTAQVLHQPVSVVTISGMRGDGLVSTSYVASTPKGSYRCTVRGGGVMHLDTTEISDLPECLPLGLSTSKHRRAQQAAG